MTAGPSRTPEGLILLVEDEPANRALFRAVKARATASSIRDARLVEAADLGAAREALDTNRVDVALLDVRLPDGNGLDLARELRARPADERPLVIVLSASVLPSEQAAALSAGADHFLSKPYDAAALCALIDSGLDDRVLDS